MKKILMVAGLLLAFIANSANATPITEEQANKFYQSCFNTKDPRLLPGSQEFWCGCVKQKMMQNFTFEDAVAYTKQDRTAMNKMLINVYSPCLEIPVHDDVFQECQKQNVPTNTCQCLAKGIGEYTQREASRLIGGVLAKYPNAFDPLAAIKQTPEFEAQTKVIARQCAQ